MAYAKKCGMLQRMNLLLHPCARLCMQYVIFSAHHHIFLLLQLSSNYATIFGGKMFTHTRDGFRFTPSKQCLAPPPGGGSALIRHVTLGFNNLTTTIRLCLQTRAAGQNMHRLGRVLHVRSTVFRVLGNRVDQDPRELRKGYQFPQLHSENGHGHIFR
jgi:hypothetical protein